MPSKAKTKTIQAGAKINKTKALIFVVAFALVGGIIILRSFAAAPIPVMYLSPASQTITTGASFSVQIRVLNQNNPPNGQNSVDAHIMFPANLLSVTSVSAAGSSFDFEQYQNLDNNAGSLEVWRANSTDLPQSDLLVVTVNFATKAAGDAPVTFAYSRFDQYGPPTLQNADYTIVNPAPAPAPQPSSGGSTTTPTTSHSTPSPATTSSTPAPSSTQTTTSPTPTNTQTNTVKPKPSTTKATTVSSVSTVPSPKKKSITKLADTALIAGSVLLALAGFGVLNAKRKTRPNNPVAHKSPKIHHPPPPHVHPHPPAKPKEPVKAPEPIASPPVFTSHPPELHPYDWMPKLATIAKGQHKPSAGAADESYVEPTDMFAEGDKRLSQEGLAKEDPKAKK